MRLEAAKWVEHYWCTTPTSTRSVNDMELLLLLAAIVCWAVGAVTGFQWFGANLDAVAILGWVSLGLFFYGLYIIVPGLVARRNPPA
jgi:hypothetical protein